MIKEYLHPELGKEVAAPAGYYLPLEEDVLPFNGRTVLFIRGTICIESSCCGRGNWNYIQVPGYILKERLPGEKAGPIVSEIETIQDESDRSQITRLLLEKYPSAHIQIE